MSLSSRFRRLIFEIRARLLQTRRTLGRACASVEFINRYNNLALEKRTVSCEVECHNLDKKTLTFFFHRDPEIARWIAAMAEVVDDAGRIVLNSF